MSSITEPLRLAVGSHKAGSGKGCAMNVISWENGDQTITDLPSCSDPMLARIVQNVNDNICTHRDADLLCVECSVKVLDLGHRTVGTGTLPLTDLERRIVWVKIAADQARQVLHLVPAEYMGAAVQCIEAAERWTSDPSDVNHAAHAAFAALAAAAHAAAHAAAATLAADAHAYAYAYAAAAYAHAHAARAVDRRLELAHRAIDLFESLTNHRAEPVDCQVTERAYAQLLEVSA